jgi:septum site-determining protein MinC
MADLFEIKSAHLSMVALQLRSIKWQEICLDLMGKYGPGSSGDKFFSHDPIILDFDYLAQDTEITDYAILLDTLKQCNLLPVAIHSKNQAWLEIGFRYGLAEATRYVTKRSEPNSSIKKESVVIEVPVTTLVLDKPVRGGQRIYAKGGDLIALQVVNSGAELIADGNIHVYAPLRGRALAGARGNTSARIFAQIFSPELVSVAGVYKTNEKLFDGLVFGSPTQVYLSADGSENLIIEAIGS